MTEEFYQPKDFSRDNARVLLRLDVSKMPPHPGRARAERRLAARLGQDLRQGPRLLLGVRPRRGAWDNRDIAQMYFEAIKWALGLTDGDVTPRPLSNKQMTPDLLVLLMLALAIGASAAMLSAQDWPYRGGDPGEQRFSPLKQITPANVAHSAAGVDVRRRRVGSSGDAARRRRRHVLSRRARCLRARAGDGEGHCGSSKLPGAGQPARRRVLARRSRRRPARSAPARATACGARRRRPESWRAEFRRTAGPSISRPASRATSTAGSACRRRRRSTRTSSLPAATTASSRRASGLYGDIRGWDARTGKLLWSFHTVPRPGEPGIETWEGDSWKNRSGTNIWSFFTVDVERGIVFAPTGSPTSDYYGGDRKGNNLYGNSLVALDATTGKLKWYPAARAPRPLGLRSAGRADADRRDAQRPHDPRRRGDDEDGAALHLRSRDRRADFGMEERPVPKSNVRAKRRRRRSRSR